MGVSSQGIWPVLHPVGFPLDLRPSAGAAPEPGGLEARGMRRPSALAQRQPGWSRDTEAHVVRELGYFLPLEMQFI